jgi:hypothetical protein
VETAILIVWAVFWVGWLVAAFGAKRSVTRRHTKMLTPFVL